MKQIYGLLGYPLGHSFSKEYFNNKFYSEELNAEYINFQVPNVEDVNEIIKAYKTNLNGLNVTIPYKESVIPFLDELDPCAKEIGAVNVIKIIRNKDKIKLKGYNSDWKAFYQTLEDLLKPYHRKALILGTGGASKAVAYALQKLNIDYQHVSRSKENMLTYDDLDENVIEDHTIIINTTPLGMFPNVNGAPNIPYQYLTNKHLLYDLLYNPEKTTFMKKGEERGTQIKNGLEMLLLQAFIGWQIWNE